MSIDFSKIIGWNDRYGALAQVADASGRVLWVLNTGGNTGSGKIVLEVEKITADTYAGETTYTAEEFLVLDIYPKTKSSTVYVTYGDLTKTLTFSGTNAQQVYFGTLYGVADEVETPANGELTIEGDCEIFNVGTYTYYNTATKKSSTTYCGCIAGIVAWDMWDGLTAIPNNMFRGCTKLKLNNLPSGIISVGSYAFSNCGILELSELPSGITSLGESCFYYCESITITELPNGITSIPEMSFSHCTKITKMTIHEGITTIEDQAFNSCRQLVEVSIPSSVTSIGNDAFYSCENLARIYIFATTPPTLGTNVFDYTNECPIIVPAGCGEAYKAATNWSGYADRIVEAS